MSTSEQQQRVAEAIAIRNTHQNLSSAGPEYADKYKNNLDNFQLHVDLYGEYLIADAIQEADYHGIEIAHPLGQLALNH